MTKLYLHREGVGTLPSGTLPSGEQSSLTPDSNLFDNEDGSENRLMDSTISASSQTSLTNTSTGDVNTHNYYIARWVSPKLNMTSISANTWNLKFAASESNTNANFPRNGAGALRIVAYAWKPSNGTKYGDILDGNSAADFEEAGTSQTLIEGTFSGAAVSSLTANDVVIVFELWAIVTQGMNGTYTQTVFYDGTTESSTSNNAAFIETPQTLTFSATLFERTADQTITISETAAKVATKNRSVSDTISLSDAINSVKVKVIAISQSIGVTDAVNRMKTAIVAIPQTITLTDALAKSALKFISIPQTISLSDSVNKVKTAIRDIGQTISFTDSVDKVALKLRSINQTISLTDAVERLFIAGGQLFERAINETISLSDSVTKVATKLISLSQTISLTDALGKSALKLISIPQSIGVTDSINKIVTRIIQISQNVGITDAVSKSALKIRSISQNIGITDAVERVLLGAGQLFHITINETITLTDSISQLFTKFRTIFKTGSRTTYISWKKQFAENKKKWDIDWKNRLNKQLNKYKFKYG